MNKVVHYGPDYPATSDFYAEQKAKELLVKNFIFTSSSIVVLAVQVLIREKVLDYKTTILEINELGYRFDDEGDFIDSNPLDYEKNKLIKRLWEWDFQTGE